MASPREPGHTAVEVIELEEFDVDRFCKVLIDGYVDAIPDASVTVIAGSKDAMDKGCWTYRLWTPTTDSAGDSHKTLNQRSEMRNMINHIKQDRGNRVELLCRDSRPVTRVSLRTEIVTGKFSGTEKPNDIYVHILTEDISNQID